MSDQQQEKTYPILEALRAQDALRKLAGLKPERFPIRSFVGMISDEIEVLREKGHSDEQIARTIQNHSNIVITAEDVAGFYASAEERRAAHR